MWTYVAPLFLYFVFKRARSEIVVFFVQYEALKEITVRVFSQVMMDNSPNSPDLSAKRTHITTGSTPSKPVKKRVRTAASPAIKKPLFSSQVGVPSNSPSFKSLNRKVSVFSNTECFLTVGNNIPVIILES